jgi:low affinity Fe/Cu permease
MPDQQRSFFGHMARAVSDIVGTPAAFATAVAFVFAWAATGPVFGFSDTWQLVINTGTTILTFLVVFVIQNTQNRDTRAIQIKLDELIRATKGAHDSLIDLEELDEEQLRTFQAEFEKLAKAARKNGDRGEPGA